MTNAVLRRFLRERQTLSDNLSGSGGGEPSAVALPGAATAVARAAAAILAANNQQPPMVLRVNSRLISRQAYLDKLAGQGIEATAGQLSSQAVYLAQPRDVAQLPGFAEGEASVQDEAAQLAARCYGRGRVSAFSTPAPPGRQSLSPAGTAARAGRTGGNGCR